MYTFIPARAMDRASAASVDSTTICSGASKASGPRIARALAVCSGVVKYGCAPFAAEADSSSIFGPRAASTRPGGAGTQLCQGHCPVQHVATEFPQLCDAETAVFSRLVGAPVQRLATLAHGEHVCTTHVSHGRTPA